MAILVAIVGGVGTIYGPAVGAFIMVAFQEIFRTGFFGLFEYLGDGISAFTACPVAEVLTQAHVLGFGILVIVVILYLPNGVVGDWEKIKRNVFRHRRRRDKESGVAYFRVEKLVKNFGGLTAVNEVTFEVEKGEIFGLIGPNGSGKTTTFNMISGVYPPTVGEGALPGTGRSRG